MKLDQRLNLGLRAAATGALALVVSVAACGGSVETNPVTTQSSGPGGPTTDVSSSASGSTGTGITPPPGVSSKVDLLLMIDNSRSMADKQEILGAAVPDLVQRLANPPCVDANGAPAPQQPQSPLEACPAGTMRVAAPVLDIHIGVISSSLGGHGSDACSVTGDVQSCPGQPNISNNDAGHLLSRADACSGATIPTYQNEGFLAWDPAQKLSPPGEASAGDLNGKAGLIPSFRDLVVGLGQVGCGYESQLESWYRFLIEPSPYQTIIIEAGKATQMGIDTVLLQQRANFLRPSSLLAIVMLTDENDCSVKESGQFYYAVQQQNPQDSKKKFHLPRARKECATNPNDPCCKSCGQAAPSCPADQGCTTSPTLSDAEDDINLRCFDQKRRFGIDFLYPLDRYTSALSSPMVPDFQGNMVPNPIFSDLNPSDGDSVIRTPSLVVLAGIVGVPWQAIARDPGDVTKGFRNAGEMTVPDASGNTGWDNVLGDPASYVAPKDPHMVESSKPRPGLPGPASPPNADPISGHDYSIANNDLQYACVFPLTKPRDCSAPGVTSCDCSANSDNPLCDPMNPTIQVRAKGYPGLRELAVLKGVGAQGVVASVCAAQVTAPTQPDYGYRPAMAAIAAALKPHLAQ
ncbi:MAG: hypothetical protein ABJE95_39480 [Byssovorax sp.]